MTLHACCTLQFNFSIRSRQKNSLPAKNLPSPTSNFNTTPLFHSHITTGITTLSLFNFSCTQFNQEISYILHNLEIFSLHLHTLQLISHHTSTPSTFIIHHTQPTLLLIITSIQRNLLFQLNSSSIFNQLDSIDSINY